MVASASFLVETSLTPNTMPLECEQSLLSNRASRWGCKHVVGASRWVIMLGTASFPSRRRHLQSDGSLYQPHWPNGLPDGWTLRVRDGFAADREQEILRLQIQCPGLQASHLRVALPLCDCRAWRDASRQTRGTVVRGELMDNCNSSR